MMRTFIQFLKENCLSGAFKRWCAFSLFSFGFVTGLTALLHDGLNLETRLSFFIPLVIVFFLNFITIRYFVYGSQTTGLFQQFIHYAISAAIFRIAEFLTYCLLIQFLHLYYLWAVLLVLPTSFFVKFVVYRYLVFASRDGARDAQNDVSEDDIIMIANLHMQSLPESSVSRLGRPFARSFYQYVLKSPLEHVIISRNNQDEVVGVCVLSLEPHSLTRRLLSHSSMILWMTLRCYRLPLIRILISVVTRNQRGSSTVTIDRRAPELLIIFSSPNERSKGTGARMLEECESWLRDHDREHVVVKTIANPTNRALEFYRRNGYEPTGQLGQHGKIYQQFRKSLS